MVDATRFRQNPDYIYREIAGEAVLVATGEAVLEFNGMAAMNETAAFLWKQLESQPSFGELSERFAAEYDLPANQAREDVEELITTALEHKLILQV